MVILQKEVMPLMMEDEIELRWAIPQPMTVWDHQQLNQQSLNSNT
jgi:hypothetical protein